MRADQHKQILVIGFATISTILFLTFALLLLASAGVFVALGITMVDPLIALRHE